MSKIGISCGDPAGIGPEIVFKTLKQKNLPKNTKIYIVGEKVCFRNQGFDISKIKGVNFIEEKSLGKTKYHVGLESAFTGRASYRYFLKCMQLLKEGFLDGMVTAPVSKRAINLAGMRFRGHTEELEKFFGKETVMLMSSDQIKTSLFTRHIPLKIVSFNIKKDKLKRHIIILAEGLKKMYGIPHPHIAVCALNPHGGEKGIFGDEERIVEAAIKELKYKNLYGPFPADTLFLKRGDFDCIVSLYHDQGMIPFKFLSFNTGCNVTLGLDRVRTSPAHGVAFDIAGKDKASFSSFKYALLEAVKLARNMGKKK